MTSATTVTVAMTSGAVEAVASRGRVMSFVDSGAMTGEALRLARAGYRTFVLHGQGDAVGALAEGLRTALPALGAWLQGPPPAATPGCAHFYVGMEEGALRDALMRHVDAREAALVAPVGARHSARLPLFLISIPKAGTHLLYELARGLGYRDGVVCPDEPHGGTWYCIEYSNSHTAARDFLVDTTRRGPFGNKHHPFFRSPALFIYRNPLDVLVSESNWYHEPRNSPLAGYLSHLDRPARLLRLADDPWLLGSIRDRVGAFIPWLDFPNVIPLSFEELIGARGGGSDEAQLDLIWSLQLKLQVAGRPEDIARRVFNPDSPTFAGGRVGGWQRHRTPEAEARVRSLPVDFLEAFGFAPRPGANDVDNILPVRAAEFRRRPLRLPELDFSETPIAVESGMFEHNVVRYRNRYFTVPHTLGAVDLTRDADRIFSGVKSAATLDDARVQILRRRVYLGPLWRFWKSFYTRIRRR